MPTLYSLRLPPSPAVQKPLHSWVVFAGLAGYLTFVRSWGVSTSLWLLRDQMRDWRFAMGSFGDLPLTGTQSSAGGSSFGPIYYWLLWVARRVVGPFTSYQPHAGALGLSMVQTGADLAFFHALRKRTESTWFALAVTLFSATAAHDLAITMTIWNPTVCIAFVKFAIAAVLLDDSHSSVARSTWVTVLVWLAVQAHSAALFIAAPVVGAYLLRDLFAARLGTAIRRLRANVEIILVLQLPFLYFALTHVGDVTPVRAVGGITQGLRLGASADAMLGSLAHIVTAPWTLAVGAPLLVACMVLVAVRARRDLRLLSVTVLPMLCTLIGFSVWQGDFDEYWYLPLAPCAALTVGIAVTSWYPRYSILAFLAVVLALQPARITRSRALYRMPEYAAMARGARAIFRQTKVIRRVETTFEAPPLSDPAFVYEAMGGRLDATASFDAVIDESGGVQFRKVSEP